MTNFKILTLVGALFLMDASCKEEADSVQPNQLLKAIPAAFADQTSEFAFDF